MIYTWYCGRDLGAGISSVYNGQGWCFMCVFFYGNTHHTLGSLLSYICMYPIECAVDAKKILVALATPT